MSDYESFDIDAASLASHTHQLEQLRIANHAKLADLRSKGADLQPLSVFTKRLELLIEFLLPEGGDPRAVFEILYENTISNIIDEASSAVRRAMLTAPLQGPINNGQVANKLMRPPGNPRG